MSNGDMRYGRCASCGSDEVYQAEFAAQASLRPPGRFFGGKQKVLVSLICAGCGHMQWQLPMDEDTRTWLRKFPRVPPSSPWQQ
ncbi:hypothetical protein [Streptomyces sp. ODS28]|uniref:hypothetical protein n=1 Tax=Streptomyces sp. ODS28 TaxID=3136688 RepID=UPI0031F19B2C